ncbi:MAG: hypothetical protein PHW96_00985 [Candidatus Nanoarchaeia archaeon]|nr:hypothetical protein [Candidatus Nanoarchaeia archaeon]
MKLNVIKKEKDVFFDRTNVSFEIEHIKMATPNRLEARKLLAKEFDKDIKEVILLSLNTNFGSGKSIGTAHVYTKQELISKSEPKYIIKRNEIKEELSASKEGESQNQVNEGPKPAEANAEESAETE